VWSLNFSSFSYIQANQIIKSVSRNSSILWQQRNEYNIGAFILKWIRYIHTIASKNDCWYIKLKPFVHNYARKVWAKGRSRKGYYNDSFIRTHMQIQKLPLSKPYEKPCNFFFFNFWFRIIIIINIFNNIIFKLQYK